MILRTSKILIFFGPIIGHFWARGPCICGLPYTKILQKIIESIWEHLGKYYFPMSDKQKIWKFPKGNPTIFWIYVLDIYFVYILYIFFEYVCSKYFCGDEDFKRIHFPLIKSTKAWLWISFVSKTWTGFYPKVCIFKECTLNLFQGMYPKLFQGRYPELFYF